jgi:hypothetical protein
MTFIYYLLPYPEKAALCSNVNTELCCNHKMRKEVDDNLTTEAQPSLWLAVIFI